MPGLPQNMHNVSERIVAFNHNRLPDMVKLKYEAMAENHFRFFRGTCHLFYQDLKTFNDMPASPLAWVCGDLHIENYGSYKGTNKLVYFDINDFDEGLLAPCLYEITRMVTSIFIAFDALKFEPAKALNMASLFIKTYAATLVKEKAFCIEPRTAKGVVCEFLSRADKAREQDVLKKRTISKKKKIMLSLADERHFKVDKKLRAELTAHINTWIQTSDDGPYNYRVKGVVFRLAGTGSIGVKRYLFLLKSTNAKQRYLLLDMKQSTGSSVLPYLDNPQAEFNTEAARIVSIQQRMQYISSSLLSTTVFRGQPYVIQELQPVKDTINFKHLEDYRDMYQVVDDMASITASAQLRSGGMQGSATIDQLAAFGKQTYWQEPILNYARQYAEQVKTEYKDFMRDFRSGKLTADSLTPALSEEEGTNADAN